uniref:Fibrinogen-like protein 1 n=1 Tax=Neolamprologus brichardi TaxID=32507 RepID=A0A3Q4N399_NEOBR
KLKTRLILFIKCLNDTVARNLCKRFYAPVQAPVPCEERVSRLEAEIQGLMNVISEQHRYIQELHSSQAQQLQQIPNSYLGLDDLYRGTTASTVWVEPTSSAPEAFLYLENKHVYTERHSVCVCVCVCVDCSEVFEDGNVASGLYVIRPDGAAMALSVYCDMNHGGGWTVFQRRRDGKESFDRSWVEYKHGFGDLFSPAGEFWLGNEPLHHLTSQGNYDLRINMEDFEGNERYADFKFNLMLTLQCNAGNLNGHYYDGPFKAMTDDGVVWYTWHGWAYSIKSVVMMIRAQSAFV